MEKGVLSVSDINRMVKDTLEGNLLFRRLWVQGEISNFRHHTSGHMYFTLKDDASRLKCVMFRGRNIRLRFRPRDGQTVVATGSLSVYEVAGEYQLVVDELADAGVGALHLAFEQLKEKLAQEGLFDPAHKRPIPFLPRTVGIVTSPTGAAIRDIVTVLRRRHPGVNIVLAPAIVQGEAGPPSVVRAIERLNARDDIDVMIVGRGGGAYEELWTFNDERVVRAAAASRIPVISAVGHETDVTLIDFAADHRAPTPSAAAELAVPEWAGLDRELKSRVLRLQVAGFKRVSKLRDALKMIGGSPVLVRPTDRINQRRQQLDDLMRRAEMLIVHNYRMQRQRLETVVGKLDGLSPLGTLARGYAICRLKETGQTVTDYRHVKRDDHVQVMLKRGELICVVLEGKGESDE